MRFAELPDGHYLLFSAVEAFDAPVLARIINEPLPNMILGREPRSVAEVETLLRHWRRDDTVVFAIRPSGLPPEELLGCVGLFGIRRVDRNAELRIFLAQSARGHGFGFAATKFIVEYGFRELGLHRVWLGVSSDNAVAIRCYEKAGFQREGVLRDEVWTHGRFVDAIRMSILESEERR